MNTLGLNNEILGLRGRVLELWRSVVRRTLVVTRALGVRLER
jgi:hypothetical protein